MGTRIKRRRKTRREKIDESRRERKNLSKSLINKIHERRQIDEYNPNN